MPTDMENKALIKHFYESFARHDAEAMVACYHENVEFSDPAFPSLKGEEARNMWRMLISRGKATLKITFENDEADEQKGSADWTAEYVFSQTGRKVVNKIHAEFQFQDGKIIRHIDKFDFWKWSSQALGMPGIVLGWSSFLKAKVRQKAAAGLAEFIVNRNI
jgi:ketosteroid isomerase-like protein